MIRSIGFPWRFKHLTNGQKVTAGLIGALLTSGVVLIADGAYLKAKAVVAQVLLEQAFVRALAGDVRPKPWKWADTWPVARIEVPRLSVSSIVLDGASGEALAFGPGLLHQAAVPGDPGTAIIAAHRDTHFRYLRDVKKDDLIQLTRTDGQTLSYRVTGFRVVTWDRPGIDVNTPASHLVLVTCFPFDAKFPGPLRYLVESELIGMADRWQPTGQPQRSAHLTTNDLLKK